MVLSDEYGTILLQVPACCSTTYFIFRIALGFYNHTWRGRSTARGIRERRKEIRRSCCAPAEPGLDLMLRVTSTPYTHHRNETPLLWRKQGDGSSVRVLLSRNHAIRYGLTSTPRNLSLDDCDCVGRLSNSSSVKVIRDSHRPLIFNVQVSPLIRRIGFQKLI
jgi:hypothetical protein